MRRLGFWVRAVERRPGVSPTFGRNDPEMDLTAQRAILELVGEASKRYLDLQIRSNETLDSRISGAVALGTTIIPLS